MFVFIQPLPQKYRVFYIYFFMHCIFSLGTSVCLFTLSNKIPFLQVFFYAKLINLLSLKVVLLFILLSFDWTFRSYSFVSSALKTNLVVIFSLIEPFELSDQFNLFPYFFYYNLSSYPLLMRTNKHYHHLIIHKILTSLNHSRKRQSNIFATLFNMQGSCIHLLLIYFLTLQRRSNTSYTLTSDTMIKSHLI